MRRFLPLVLAFALAGCATFQNPVTRSGIDALNASWGATLTILNGYRDSCERRIIPPSCRTVVAELQRAGRPVHAAVKRAREFAKNPRISTVDLVRAASDALNDFKLVMMQYGVQ